MLLAVAGVVAYVADVFLYIIYSLARHKYFSGNDMTDGHAYWLKL